MNNVTNIPQVEDNESDYRDQQRRIAFYAQRINEITLKAKAEEMSRKKAERIGGAV